MVTKEERGGGGGEALGVWDGNAAKLGCDDCCTAINVVKFIEYFKRKNKNNFVK